MDHRFGGGWTQIKLDILGKYLHFYNTALKNQPFKRHYIDAFAGCGSCTIRSVDGSLTIDGSAKIALDTTPAFHSFHFIEQDNQRFDALSELCAQHPEKTIHLHHGNANDDLLEIIDNIKSKPLA